MGWPQWGTCWYPYREGEEKNAVIAAEQQVEFFREKLDVQASAVDGMATWKERSAHLLEGRAARKKRDQEIVAGRNAGKAIPKPATSEVDGEAVPAATPPKAHP